MMIPIYIPEHLQAQYDAQLAAMDEQYGEYEGADPGSVEQDNVSYSHTEQSALAALEFYGEPHAEMTQESSNPLPTNKPWEGKNRMKRKRDWDDKEEHGDEAKGTRALPVADSLPKDGIPTNGEEYLLTVRIHAASLPETTRAVNFFTEMSPPSDSRRPGYGVTSYPSEKAKPPIERHPRLPSDEWILTFCAKFDVFRETLRSADFQLSPEALAAAQNVRLPGPKDVPAWRRLIYQPRPRVQKLTSGTSRDAIVKQSTGDGGVDPVPPREGTDISNYNSQMDSDNEQNPENHSNFDTRDMVEDVNIPLTQIVEGSEILDQPVDGGGIAPPSAISEGVKDCMQSEEGCVPDLALMRRLDRNHYSHLIAHFCHWLSQSLDNEVEPSSPVEGTEPKFLTALSENDSKWLFSLLAHADNELVGGKDIGILRDLARVCMELVRRSLNAEARLRNSNSSEAGEPNAEGLEDGEMEGDASTNNWGPPDPIRDRETGRTSCWMVVAAIVNVWRQSDLWFEASARLYGDFHYSEAVDISGYTL